MTMTEHSTKQTNKQLKEVIIELHRNKKVPFVIESLSGLMQFFHPKQELKINDTEVHVYSHYQAYQDNITIHYKDIRKIHRLVLEAEKITEFDMPVVHVYGIKKS